MKRIFPAALLVALCAARAPGQPAPWLRTNGPYGGDIHWVIAGPGDTVFAATQVAPGVIRPYRSTDLGASWSEIRTVAGSTFAGPMYRTPSGVILLSTSDTMSSPGFARSTDGGNSWTQIGSGFIPSGFCTDAAGGVWCSSSGSGLFRTTDAGLSWVSMNGDMTGASLTSVTADTSGALYAAQFVAGGQANGVYKSTDGGSHWSRVLIYAYTVPVLCTTRAGSILAGTLGDGVYRSTNGGTSWLAASGGLTNRFVISLASDTGGTIFAGTRDGCFRSTDDGSTWNPLTSGLANRYIWALAGAGGGTLFAGTATSVFCSTDRGDSWHESAAGIGSALCTLVAANSSGTIVTATNAAGGLYRTTNQGATWLSASTGLEDRKVISLASGDEGTFFAGVTADTDGVAVFRSRDQGATWSGLNTQMKSLSALDLATAPGGEIVAASTAGNDGTGIYRSTDNGITWSALTTGLANNRFWSVAISPSDYIFGSYWGGVMVSTDHGTSWSDKSIGLPFAPIYDLGTNAAGILYAATGDFGVYMFTSGDWTLIDKGVSNIDVGGIVSLAFDSAGNVFGGSTGEGAYKLPAGGYLWQTYSAGLNDSAVTSICIDSSGTLYAATGGDGVYRNGGTLLSAARSVQRQPDRIGLMQNYPNPFNPRTVIDYVLSSAAEVTIRVYSVLGQRIATLMDGRAGAGLHEITWDASRYPSGTYFCELRSGATRMVRRMILLK